PVRRFLKWAERLAVQHSDDLIADSLVIKEYLFERYSVHSQYIPYGAEPFESPDQSVPEKYNLKERAYSMLIARMEPENNIEMILEGYHRSGIQEPLFVIGNCENAFGRYLKREYSNDNRIQFAGAIYRKEDLNNLRYFCS